jgi:8-oxo-dGTP diphosphatase
MRSRAVAIIINKETQSLLTIHRYRTGREYYVLPGGKIENGESPAQACAREVREETGLTITVGRLAAELYNEGREEYYFLASEFSGKLQIGFPELGWQSAENVYELEWVPARRLEEIRLLPEEIKAVVLKNLSQPS